MRHPAMLLALAACSAAFAAGAPGERQQRDGVWLQNGIRQHEVVVTSYICGVVSFERYLVQRAELLEGALRRGKKRKQPIDSRMLAGMVQALPLVAPLMKSDFLSEDPSCDQAVGLVGEFLDKYPEVIDKDAGELVEKALLAAYVQPAAN